ncbi:hypothetical protein BT96DRAFT_1001749 [Gymnopus androsaceus JB14]|uniref:Uncharacterized protein n=1 Tax=Gymnopus androsaceus JB14 TaxID=1447944 RepID=A0A6A4H0W0_9AGAR|nr:hypothetical protein BT96DRAFT_1001749 [Gymnopus androsaceus JB14]
MSSQGKSTCLPCCPLLTQALSVEDKTTFQPFRFHLAAHNACCPHTQYLQDPLHCEAVKRPRDLDCKYIERVWGNVSSMKAGEDKTTKTSKCVATTTTLEGLKTNLRAGERCAHGVIIVWSTW